MEGAMVVRVDVGCHLATLDGTGSEESPITFQIVPVLISQGINEQQTIANAVGNAGRQVEINQRGVARMGLCVSFLSCLYYFLYQYS